jgi:recombination associated protein RdgC
MLLKNLLLYRLPEQWKPSADELEQSLAAQQLQRCGGFDMESRGWLPPQDDGAFIYHQNGHWLVALGVEQKLLPASVIRQQTEERVVELAKRQPYPVGRKQKRDLKQQVTDELLPRALSRRSVIHGWIDRSRRLLAIDAAGDAKAELFLEALRRADAGMDAIRVDTQVSPATAMAGWLLEHDVPGRFSIDDDLELRASDATRATVRYVRHGLQGKDIRDHLAAGKAPVRLGLTWNDKVSFVLTEHLHVKRISFPGVLNQEPGGEAEEDEAERFDIDFALMTGELSVLVEDLLGVLGGERQ